MNGDSVQSSDESSDEPAPGAARAPAQVLDAELAAMQVLLPHIDVSKPQQARLIEADLTGELNAREREASVERVDHEIERSDGSTIALRIYRSVTNRDDTKVPGLLFLHGGSFITGGLHSEDTRCEFYATHAGCDVFAVEYRLAPEDPFPAGLDDCSTALKYMREQAEELGLDVARLAVGGLSAGGALASGVAGRAALDQDAPLVLQLLIFPVLDASLSCETALQSPDTPVLNTGTLLEMWKLYLGASWSPGGSQYPQDSSPIHCEQPENLPPTFICTAGLDPLRDEAIEYTKKLLEAGVPVDLRHYARGFHAFDSFHFTRLGRQAMHDQVEALRAAFN